MENSVQSIAHVTSWLSRQGGGIPPVVRALAREINQLGFPCSVFGLRDQWLEEDYAGGFLPFTTGNVVGPKALGYSPELSARLSGNLQRGEIVHSHGLWMYPGMAARKAARKKRCPLVISPHGMLEPWALNNSRLKKKLAAWLFENKNLHAADCLHALCAAEAENFRRYGLKNPIAVIPNGVDMDDLSATTVMDPLIEKFPETKGRHCILFLSRLHPKKGLFNLLEAWRQTAYDFKDWCLLVAGSGQPAYEQELKNLVKDYALEKSVIFCGPVYGEDKKQVLAAADVFILPSFSEGFSVAILEAAAAGLPVLLTPECNFPELAKSGAAIEILPNASAIEVGLRQILELSEDQRKAMGRRGQKLMRESYSWPVIAGQMCRVYGWLKGSTATPDVVEMY